ncbi:MAG: hypothetical protein ACK5W9_14495 [Bdellovibrionales bacterium]
MSGRKGGYGDPTTLDMRKGEKSHSSKGRKPIIIESSETPQPQVRDVTPQATALDAPPPTPKGPPPQAHFIYNGHDWDAYEVLGVSPYSSFSEITRSYQEMILKAEAGKHEFLQAAFSAILKKF